MKRILEIMLFIGFCYALLLILAQRVFQIPDDVFWRYYWIFAGIIIVVTTAFSTFCSLHYQKKMEAAAQLLESGRTEEYIEELESLRRRSRSRFAKNMFTINLSAGYCKLEQFNKAAELLESLSDVKLSGALKLVHCINLCICYFYQKQTDRAMALYKSSQKIFHPYRGSKLCGGNIAVLDVFAAISMNDYVRAAELLQTARNVWDDSRFSDDYCYLEKNIHQLQREQMKDETGEKSW